MKSMKTNIPLKKYQKRFIKKNIPRKNRKDCLIVVSDYNFNYGEVFIFYQLFFDNIDEIVLCSHNYGKSWERIS